MTSEFFPERTIRYKTYAKSTLVDALNSVFANHPDQLLQRTKTSIEFPKTEADYPCVVVKFYEREVFNAGVGNQEVVSIFGETDSIEVTASLTAAGSVQLAWGAIPNATGYRVYRGTTPDKETTVFTVAATSFTDTGQSGIAAAPPTEVTAALPAPQPTTVVASVGLLPAGTYYYRVTALAPSQAVKLKHYFYTADVEFAVYGLSAYDRDLVADTLVQTLAMGDLETYTNNFFARVYPTTGLFPDSELHFITINTDRIQGFGENQSQTAWGAEDDLMYMTSYRVGVFGELYSLPPSLTYGVVQQVILAVFDQDTGAQVSITPPDASIASPGIAWVSNTP